MVYSVKAVEIKGVFKLIYNVSLPNFYLQQTTIRNGIIQPREEQNKLINFICCQPLLATLYLFTTNITANCSAKFNI